MNVVLWIITVVLALVFLAAGLTKLLRRKSQLVTQANMSWTEDFSPGVLKAIAVLELLGVIGLILPPLANTALVCVPLAASGLALVMIGAAITHGRRGERPQVVVTLILAVLAIVVAWGRFGPYAFTS